MHSSVTFIAIVVPLLLLIPCIALADIAVLDQPLWVFPGQVFRIALQQPAGSGELRVSFPDDCLELFDQWDKDDLQRYYFRALKAGDITLRFEGNAGSLDLPVSLIPWSSIYEPREWESIQLPRMWPVGEGEFEGLKSRHTLYTEEEIEQMRASEAAPGRIAATWVEMSDDEIYNVIPGSEIPRTCLMTMSNEGRGKGCPVCGLEIYEGRDGFYPWLFDAKEHPWKVGCPNCKNWFPSNDWHKGDMHSGDFPDDGWGCEPGDAVLSPAGKPFRYPFVAYYHEWEAYMRTFTPGMTQCAQAYITTGDKRYAHKCAIALFRFAESFMDMSLNLNHRKLANRDGITTGPVGAPLQGTMKRLRSSFSYIQPNWDTPRMGEAARAYDLILDAIDGDEELLRFCQDRYHEEIQTADDYRRFIEAGVHRVCAQMAFDNAVARNWPQQETMLTTMALAMDDPRCMEIIDWLLNKGGKIRYSLTNEYFKDGSGHESEGYNGMQIRYMNSLAKLLDRVAKLYPDLYKAPQFVSLTGDPKFKQMYLFPLWNSLIGRTTTTTGDTGKAGKPVELGLQEGYPLSPGDLAGAFELTRDPRFARALYGPDGTIPEDLLSPELRTEAEAIGKREGWQIGTDSDILDGYGHVILRSGEGEHQRALWMRYGRVVQHTHPDMLTFGFEAMKRKLLPEMGYPVGWTYASNWETNWGTHYVTHIAGRSTWNYGRGHVTLFADSPPARIATAEASYLTGGEDKPRRERTLVLVDIDEEHCYAVTLERVSGGSKHYWSFHGPDGEATPQGIDLTGQDGGTMLGPDIEYGDDSSVAKTDRDLSCFAFMYDVARGEANGPWSLDYLLRDQGDMHLRMTSVHPSSGTVATAKGKAPGGRSAYEITWAIQEQEGVEPLATQFLSVLEPYEGERLVSKVEPVSVEGGDGAAEPLAVRITGKGFVDTLIFQPEGGALCRTPDGLESDGAVGFWRERDGKPAAAVLAQGTRLARGGTSLALATGEYTGTIQECDWERLKVRVRGSGFRAQEAKVTRPAPGTEYRKQDVSFVGLSPEQAGALIGQHVRFSNELGSNASYLVKDARWVDDMIELTLELDPRLGEGSVDSVGDSTVNSAIGMRLASYGYYAGKTLANEDGSRLYKLRDVANGAACQVAGEVPQAELQEAFADRDRDGTARFLIYDYGPGDTVTLNAWISARFDQGPQM